MGTPGIIGGESVFVHCDAIRIAVDFKIFCFLGDETFLHY
jgi:TPP-dependent indolepyruvate ferredoxin oxidoreductase alpha subunit